MRSTHARRWVGCLAAAIAAFAVAAAPAAAAPSDVEVQLLGINDFHGNLKPPSGSSGRILPEPGQAEVNAGGAGFLATHIAQLEQANPNTLVVSAGDLIGASPLISALFHDEPTIEAMNEIGLDLNAVGNHEFDEGAAELIRMQEGGCHPVDGCQDGDGFAGADFQFLAANVVDRASGQPVFPAYAIRKFGGIKVGFIGMTLEGTPNIVSPSGVAGLDFLDEAETANRYAEELRRQHGVRAIVVLLHEGGFPSPFAGINACNVAGPIVDIVERTDQAVDLFITGHTHQPYNCVIDGRPVTSASSFGRLVTDLDVTLDRQTKDVRRVLANNRIITRDVALDGGVQTLIDRYDALSAPLANRVVGRLAAPATRAADDSAENQAGNLIADAQLAATDDPDTGQAVAAFMNPGGVRADFPAGDITYEQAFTIQPFGNSLVTMTLTGEQVLQMLKEQFCGATSRRVLLPSSTVGYTWDLSVAAEVLNRPCATSPTPVSDVTIGGAPVDPAASYRITVNSFLADGGDVFPVLREGTDRLGGEVDLDALEAYLLPTLTGDPLQPPALDRISVIP